MRKVYILPNSFTAASMGCGVAACLEILDGRPESIVHACWLVIAAALFDVMDGAIARLTHSTSAFGVNFDSLADVVSFGVAPTMIAYAAFVDAPDILANGVCCLFAICAGLRLARFNVQSTREERKSFSGLPTPAAALGIVSLNWIYAANSWLPAHMDVDKVLLPALVVLAYLMVSKVPFHGIKSVPIGERQPFEILVSLVVIGCLFVVLKRHLDLLVFVVAWGYILGSVIYSMMHPVVRTAVQGAGDGPSRRTPAPPPPPVQETH